MFLALSCKLVLFSLNFLALTFRVQITLIVKKKILGREKCNYFCISTDAIRFTLIFCEANLNAQLDGDKTVVLFTYDPKNSHSSPGFITVNATESPEERTRLVIHGLIHQWIGVK